MSDRLLKDATLSVPASNPFEINFSGATDLLLPFDGAVVIPVAPAAAQPSASDLLARIQGVDHHSFLFHSLRYPVATDTPGQWRFGNLRSPDNRPFTVSGTVVCFVDQDYTALDDLHFDKLFSDIKNFYGKKFPEDLRTCAIPKYVLLRLDQALTLPQNFAPKSRNKDFALRANADPHFAALKAALGTGALSGKIYCFDVAGRQVAGQAGLRALGVKGAVAGEPGPKEVLVQFVDVFGDPLELGKGALAQLTFDPAPIATPLENLYKFSFGTDKKLKITENTPAAAVEAGKKYQYRDHHLTYFPGYGFGWKAIKQEAPGPLELDLDQKYAHAEGEVPASFLRLCVFHPEQTFQTTAGGGVDEHGTFKLTPGTIDAANGFQLAPRKNAVNIFTNGADYFRDLFDEVTKEEDRVELKSIFLTNWSANAHVAMKGLLSLYDIDRSDEPTETFTAALHHITTSGLAIACAAEEEDDEGNAVSKEYTLFIPESLEAGTSLSTPFQIMVRTIPGLNEDVRRIHRGFVRPGSLFALQLEATTDGNNYEAVALWKNSIGEVYRTAEPLAVPTRTTPPRPLPAGLLALGITNEDPARPTLVRKQAYADTLAALVDGGGSPLNDTGLDLQVLAISLTGGDHFFCPLGASPATTDAQLQLIPRLQADDRLAVALVNRTADAAQEFGTTLLTSFRLLRYSHGEHLSGNIPLMEEELGGMLRRQIAAGVDVKALYWEQFLANMAGGDGVLAGHKTNAEIAAVINRSVATKRGLAARDRATRPFGSFHQKAIVLIKEVTEEITEAKTLRLIAYVGGIDLDHGRWDTGHHHTDDPDRYGGAWHDVQIKINGEAAADVALNFKQRWEALNVFMQANDDECKPANPDAALQLDFAKDLKIPAADKRALPGAGPFIQINRTIPPFSCYDKAVFGAAKFVGAQGEAGAYESYIKAIRAARDFVLIHDQYFFSEELAAELHEALRKPDGPKFAILLLPKDLNEQDQIDPLLFLTRKRAIHALYYGVTGGATSGSRCGTFTLNPPSATTSVRDRVAILHPVNRDGKGTYVHSKHLIVDDLWMSVGSSNMNYRSMWYDVELNAAMVGAKLFRGGTDLVMDHRVDLCAEMLGLPAGYRALLQDMPTAFALCKVIEGQGGQPDLHLHPLRPMVRGLDPGYVKKTEGRDPQFDAAVDSVVTTDLNSPALTFVSCNILDADGRDKIEDRLGALMGLAGAGKNPVAAYVQLAITFDAGATATLRNHLSADPAHQAFVEVSTTTGDDPATAQGPYRLHELEIKTDTGTNNLVIQGISGRLSVPISTVETVVIGVNVTDQTDADLGCGGTLTFDPDASATTVLPGSFVNRSLTVTNGG